jgi:hypothetical protein
LGMSPRPLLWAIVALLALSAYQVSVLHFRGIARDCGCGGSFMPLTTWSIARTLLLSVVAAIGLAVSWRPVTAGVFTVVAPTLGIVLAIWPGGWGWVSYQRDTLEREHRLLTR